MKYFLTLILVLSFSYSDAYYAQNQFMSSPAGSGQYGGTVPCPYTPAGPEDRRPELARLQRQIDDLDDQLVQAEKKLDDILNLDGFDNLNLKPEVEEFLVQLTGDSVSAHCSDGGSTKSESLINAETAARVELCIPEGGERVRLDANEICREDSVYNKNAPAERSRRGDHRGRSRRNSSGGGQSALCMEWVDSIRAADKEVFDLEDQIADLKEQQKKLQVQIARDQKNFETYGAEYFTEVCTECDARGPEPRSPLKPSGTELFVAGASDILNLGLAYTGYRYISKKNAQLGWDTSPLVLANFPLASNTANLYGAYRAMQGSSSWGCSDAAGYPNGANGIWGPNGNMNHYGNPGGPFYAPQNCQQFGCVPQQSFPVLPGWNNMFNPYASQGNWPFTPGFNGNNGLPFPGNFGWNGFANPFNGGINGAGSMALYGQGNPFAINPFLGGNPFFNGSGNPFFNSNPFSGNGYLNGNPFYGPGHNPFAYGGNQINAAAMASQRAAINSQVIYSQYSSLQSEYGQLMNRLGILNSYAASSGINLGVNIGINAGFNTGINTGYTPYLPGSPNTPYYQSPNWQTPIPGQNMTTPPSSSTGR